MNIDFHHIGYVVDDIKSFKEERPIIELKNLSISYGNRQIVEQLNLNIQK
mgnify:CR=1 FL=1